MIRIPRQLFVLHPERQIHALAEASAPDGFEVVVASDAASLADLLKHTAPIPLILLNDAWLAHDDAEASATRSFLDRTGNAAVVISVDLTSDATRQLLRAGTWGAAEVLTEEEATAAALHARLNAAVVTACARTAERFFGLPKSFRSHLILPAAVATAVSGGDARDLGDRLGVDRRTLTLYCTRASIPAPRRLLAWIRLLLAAEMLDEPERSVNEVAYLCGYSNSNALRTAFSQFVGRSPRQLREEGAFHVARKAFRADRRAFRRTAVENCRSVPHQ